MNFPPLFTNFMLTCDVEGTPQPNITWYKDNTLLEGQRSKTLLIEEVTFTDRGRYHCVAINFDPNVGPSITHTNMSKDAVLNIKGKHNTVTIACLEYLKIIGEQCYQSFARIFSAVQGNFLENVLFISTSFNPSALHSTSLNSHCSSQVIGSTFRHNTKYTLFKLSWRH